MGDSTMDSLVGRDHIVGLVTTLVERPRGVDRPLPIVVLTGPGGIGKSHVLNHLERVSRPELPCVRVNLNQDPNATSCRVVLDVIHEQLRGYEHPQFGRLRMRRYELGHWMQSEALRGGTDPAEDAEKTRERVLAQFIGRLRRRWKVPSDPVLTDGAPSRALRLAFGWLLRLLVPASVVLHRGVLRRILWGRHDHAAMRWYESQAARMQLPAGSGIARAAEWFGRLTGEHSTEEERAVADELLLDALLEDLRRCYLRRSHLRYRTAYCLVLIDDADLLPDAPRQNFLTLLARRRRARRWDPLLVVVTKQDGLRDELDDLPGTAEGSLVDTDGSLPGSHPHRRVPGSPGESAGATDLIGIADVAGTADAAGAGAGAEVGAVHPGRSPGSARAAGSSPSSILSTVVDPTGQAGPAQSRSGDRRLAGAGAGAGAGAQSYEQWLARFAARDRAPNPYLALPLRRLTLEQTRQLVTDLAALPTVDDSGLVLAEEMHQVSHGHPLAVALLTEALRAEHARWPARDLPSARSRLDHPLINPPRDALREETVDSYLLRRMLQRVAAPEDYIQLTDELILCGAARRMDPEVAELLITGADLPSRSSQARAQRWLDRVAGYSFVESIEGDVVVLHPLLRDLLARQLAATGTDEESPYYLVHRTLREVFLRRHRAGDEDALREYLYHSLALGDVRPLLDRLLPLLHVRTTVQTKERWLALLLSVTEAPTPTRLPELTVDTRPTLRNLLGWILPDRLHGEDDQLAEAILCTWLIRSNTSWMRVDETLLERAVRAYRALPGVDRDSLVRDQVRYLENLLRYATGERPREPLPPRAERTLPGYRMTLRRALPSRRARRNTTTAVVLVPILALTGWVAVRYADYRDSVCAPLDVRSALAYDGPDDFRAIQRLDDGQCAGITDGSFVFSDFAKPYEDRILEQNRDVERKAAQGQPVVTVVVTAMLTSDDKVSPQKDIGSGVNELEGAYLAQWRYNTGGDPTLTRTPNPLVRVLIANVGGKSRQAAQVARKIVDLSDHMPIAAVTGLAQTRPETRQAVRILGAAGIPMIASVVSGDEFRGLPHFFRVAPSNDREAVAMASFVRSRFARRRVFLLSDQNDDYSSGLARDLTRHLDEAGIRYEQLGYTAESSETGNQLRFAMERACMPSLRATPVILYTGRANELGTLFSALTDLLCTEAVVVGGDDVSSLQAPPNEGFPATAAGRLYFTAFGLDATTWQSLHNNAAPPPFYADHQRFFPDDEVNGHVIAAYDALEVALQAIRVAKSAAHEDAVSADAVYQALRAMNGAAVHRGVGGRIQFDAGGEPSDKLVVIQQVVTAHEARFEAAIGSP